MLTTVAFHCSEIYAEKAKPTETHIFVSKTSAFIYNYSQNKKNRIICVLQKWENSIWVANLLGEELLKYTWKTTATSNYDWTTWENK